MRPFVTMTALALALLPAAAFAQTPPPQQPPPATPPAQAPAAPAQPAVPKLAFKTSAGILLIQVKPDQTAVFEEMMTKLRASMMSSTDPTIKSQASFKVYRSADPGPKGNVLYVFVADPAVPNAEYSFLDVINKSMTPEQQRDPAIRELYTKWNASLAELNILNLTPVGG